MTQNNKQINNYPQLQADAPSSKLLILNIILNLVYLILIGFFIQPGNLILFYLLIFGEIFHLWQTLSYIYTVWSFDFQPGFNSKIKKRVDVFITVAGEPVEIVRDTIKAVKAMKYRNKKIYVLNDGLVAGKDNWQEIENLAIEEEVNCITRETPGGAKAGNINNALKITHSPLIAIFDADHKPFPDFLQKTVGYFRDPKLGFVQTPQFYENYNENIVTKSAWEQQELFFNPICKGKNRLNSTFMCGTNLVIKRKALVGVGGMCETSIAEDFLTSLFIHRKGWNSVYVSQILSSGLAPADFLSYYKQQLRWARGSMEVIFKHNPIFNKTLSTAQKIQYLASASYYLSGLVVLIDILLPIIFLYTGVVPLNVSTLELAIIFIPYILCNIYTLRVSDGFNYTFRALSFSVSSFSIFILALSGVLSGKQAKFAITSKTKLSGNFYSLIIPHIGYVIAVILGVFLALEREGLNASLVTNLAWAIVNITFFIPFIKAALPENPLANFQIELWGFIKKQITQISSFLS